VQEALKAATECAVDYEIIIVDDGSSDGTADVALRLASESSRLRLIRNPRNLGLGGAYKAGLAAANGAYVTWVPADVSHPADGLIPAYRAIGAADMIIPRPTNPEVRGWSRRIISGLYTRIINWGTGFNVPYYNGLTIHRVDLLRGIYLKTDSFGFQAEAIAKLLLLGASYQVVDTYITERQIGRTKAFRIKNVVAVVRTLARILRLALQKRLGAAPARLVAPPANTRAEQQSQK
jgi:glycosyltransferase involved in cell wall biosynthesis